MEPTRPRSWTVLGEQEEPLMYIVPNPLRGGTRYAVMPLQPIHGLPVIGYASTLPEDAVRIVCPLQNDEAYDEVASAVVESAKDYGYFPDTMGPIFSPDE